MAIRRANRSAPDSAPTFEPIAHRKRVRNVRAAHPLLIRAAPLPAPAAPPPHTTSSTATSRNAPSSAAAAAAARMRARSAPPFQPTASASAPASAAPHPAALRAAHAPTATAVPPPPPPPPHPSSSTARLGFLPPLKSQPAVMLPSHFPPRSPFASHAAPSTRSLPNGQSSSPPQSPPPSASLAVTRPPTQRHSVRLPLPFSFPTSSASHLTPAPFVGSPPPASDHSISAASRSPSRSASRSPSPSPLDVREKLRFRPGDLVLCRYFNYPVWPAKIAFSHQPASRGRYFTMRPTRSGDDHVMAYWVLFSGENVGGWIRTDCLVPYHPAYAATMTVQPDVPILRERRQALAVAEREYNQTPSRFGYDEQDMQLLMELCSIPINEFVDIKSQDSQAERESDPNDSREHISSPDDDTDEFDSGDHSYPSDRPIPRRSGGMKLRPRQPKRELQLHTSRVLRPRPGRRSAVTKEDTDSEENDSLYVPVKPEPREIVVTSHDDTIAPAEALEAQEDVVEHNQQTARPPSKKDLQPAGKPFARRKRGRPRKTPLPAQKTPVRSRIAKPEPAVTPSRIVKREPLDALTHIPVQMSTRRQYRRKKRGRPRKALSPPAPAVAAEPKESTSQVIDRLQRRISRQEKQIVLLSQQQRTNGAAQGSPVGHGTLPPISLLTRASNAEQIRVQADRIMQKLLRFQRVSAEFSVAAQRFHEAKKEIEETYKAVTEEGRATEEQAMELEEFLSTIPPLIEFLRTVRM